jgi:hypothetical protein
MTVALQDKRKSKKQTLDFLLLARGLAQKWED